MFFHNVRPAITAPYRFQYGHLEKAVFVRMDRYIEDELDDDEGVLYYHYEIRNGLERLEEALYRFESEKRNNNALLERIASLKKRGVNVDAIFDETLRQAETAEQD